MAFVSLQPGTINVTHRKGTAQEYRSTPVTDFAGAAINISAYADLTAQLVPQSNAPTQGKVAVGTVTGGADGILKLVIDDAELANAGLGTANLVIFGEPVQGDSPQLLASGTFQLLDG